MQLRKLEIMSRDYVKEKKRKRENKLKGYKRIGEAECQTG